MTDITEVYVALLDVLGYRARLNEDVSGGTLSLRDDLQNAMAVFQDVNEADFQYQAISDTIIVSCSSQDAFLEFLSLLKKVYIAFLNQGLLIRGGLAYDQHFKSSHVTYSHAVALAYEIEFRDAVFPRIVIDAGVIEMQEDLEINLSVSDLIAQHNQTFFLNVVDQENWQTVFGSARQIYIRDQDKITGVENVFLKHFWLQDYLLNHPFAPEDVEPYIEGMRLGVESY